MGGAIPMALGMALAVPERRIAVITGDGELMMNAGALATVASAAPQNLIIVCIDNGQHGETGGQPGHTSKRTNLTTFLWVRVRPGPPADYKRNWDLVECRLRFRLANAADA